MQLATLNVDLSVFPMAMVGEGSSWASQAESWKFQPNQK